MPRRSTPESLSEFWESRRTRVDAELAHWLSDAPEVPPRLSAAMRHAVIGGGKRLRPILCIAAFEAAGGSGQAIDSVAAALEMLHCYSLAHDDLPCMDDDDERRGRPTVHIAFDESTAILAGDALQALAFELLARFAPAEAVVAAAQAVGPAGMVGGQMADLEAEGETPTEDLVVGIHRRKTGALITACVEIGAIMGATDDRVRAQLRSYGRPLGLAFQIIDDVLEVTQTAVSLGKPVDSDVKHRKVTYPAAVGIERACERAVELITTAKSALTGFPGDSSRLVAIADFVRDRER